MEHEENTQEGNKQANTFRDWYTLGSVTIEMYLAFLNECSIISALSSGNGYSRYKKVISMKVRSAQRALFFFVHQIDAVHGLPSKMSDEEKARFQAIKQIALGRTDPTPKNLIDACDFLNGLVERSNLMSMEISIKKSFGSKNAMADWYY